MIGLSAECVRRALARSLWLAFVVAGFDACNARVFAAARLEGAPFTHAVLLAGTNELGHLGRRGEDVTKDTVVRNLFDILWMLKTAGVNKTFLCTVPETAWEEAAPWGRVAREVRARSSSHKRIRRTFCLTPSYTLDPLCSLQEINSQILYRSSISDGFTVSIDVAKLLPRSGVDAEAVKRRWDDGLHFTPDRYDELGAVVTAALKGAGVACDATHKAGHATSTSLEVRSAGAVRHAARHHHGHVGCTGAVAE